LHIVVLDKSIEKYIEKVYRTAICNKPIFAGNTSPDWLKYYKIG
jgi:hypothetical protein